MCLFDWEGFLPVQMCGVMLSGSEESTPSIVYHCVLRGLERLLLSEQLSRLDAESLVKLSVDRVNVHSPHRAMAALGLMLTCMYTQVSRGPPVPGGSVPLSSGRTGRRPQAPPVLKVAELCGCRNPAWERVCRQTPGPCVAGLGPGALGALATWSQIISRCLVNSCVSSRPCLQSLSSFTNEKN